MGGILTKKIRALEAERDALRAGPQTIGDLLTILEAFAKRTGTRVSTLILQLSEVYGEEWCTVDDHRGRD